MKEYMSLILAVVGISYLSAQSNRIERADRSYSAFDYQKAIDLYKSQINEESSSQSKLIERIADGYYFNSDFVNAELWYSKLLSSIDANIDIDPEVYYRFNQSLKANKKYSEADKWMETFIESKPEDSRGKRFVETRNYLERIAENSGRFIIKNQWFNTGFNDFGPCFYDDKLLFSSGRPLIGFKVKKHLWNNTSLYDIYEVNLKEDDIDTRTKKEVKSINTSLHESTSTVTKDGTTIYFTRNNFYKGKKGKDSIGNILLKIYKATKNEKGKWTNITPVSFNGETFSTGHPALSEDEKTLYFASDRPGGFGDTDIYRVTIHDDGAYGVPENMGPIINTEGRESFPFVTKSNKLFFASDGFYGLGGLDVFMNDLNDLNGEVYNIGEPVNSPNDDFDFIINEDTNKGYFASNRKGGIGGDDIYGFVRTKAIDTKCEGSITGTVIDTHLQKPLSNATLKLINSEGKEIASTVSDEQGKFAFDASCAKERYKIVGTKSGHEDAEAIVNLNRQNKRSEVQVDLIKLPLVESDILELRPIYFALNKSVIRKSEVPELTKVLNYMKENPTVKIEIRSHTDSRGSAPYNLKLSDRRAKSTAKWIVDQGISNDRISGKGFGESQLINQCSNGVKCNNAAHEENRRSEFVVVEK